MTNEVITKEESSGIPIDHPKNPATILSNISQGFLRSYQNCMEFNALTNMGLCLFQVSFNFFFLFKNFFLKFFKGFFCDQNSLYS